jgi:hypothetical protein
MNGAKCTVKDDIPYCKCPSNRFIGTRCDIDLFTVRFDNQTALKVEALKTSNHHCDILGNDATPMHHAVAMIVLFFLLVIIFSFIYFFFYLRMKQTKR